MRSSGNECALADPVRAAASSRRARSGLAALRAPTSRRDDSRQESREKPRGGVSSRSRRKTTCDQPRMPVGVYQSPFELEACVPQMAHMKTRS